MDGRTDIGDVSLIRNFLEEVSNMCSGSVELTIKSQVHEEG